MRVKNYGLAFDFVPTQESYIADLEIEVANQYVTQNLTNFVLINYYKKEKTLYASNTDGFQNITKQLYIEMFSLDTNPRKYIYDKRDDAIYKIMDTPISQEFDPSKRKIYTLPIELVNNNNLRFNMEFIRSKFNELWEILNAI